MKCIKCGTIVSEEQLSECEKKGTNGIYCIIHLNELFNREDVGEWKDLDIKFIPTDMYNPNYQFQFFAESSESWIGITSSIGAMLDCLNCGTFKYRYRLKPLESIRVTKKQLKEILRNGCDNYSVGTEQQRNHNGYIKEAITSMTIGDNYMIVDGRKVEILK